MLRKTIHAFALYVLATSLAAAPQRASAARDGHITVFAAASLKTAVDELARDWLAKTETRVRTSYAGSARLAVQIQHGAPADVFISAHPQWMDVLEHGNLIEPGSRRDLVGNQLVLIAHGRDVPAFKIGPGFELRELIGGGRLAMGLVQSVPAGMYGKAALRSLGVWEDISERLAQTDNVRAALALVARGEAPFGIVYQSDAAASPTVSIVGRFPSGSHPVITYPAAVVRNSRNAAKARSLLDFLATAEAKDVFRRHGFVALLPAQSQ